MMKNTIFVLVIILFASCSLTAQSNNKYYSNSSQNNYQNNEYNYYQQTWKSAKHKRNFGIILTSVGFAAAVIGEAEYYGNPYDIDIQEEAALVYLVGVIAVNVGVILWISGGIKAANNRKAMQRMYNRQTSLSFGTTKNGVGLLLSFN